MMKTKAISSAPLRLLAAGLLLVICVGVSLGVSYARYQKTVRAEVQIQPDTAPFSVTAEPWQMDGEAYQTTFSVQNSGREAWACSVQLLASLGLESPDRIRVQLVLGEQSYEAIAEPIPQGSALYGSFGPGWLYRFTDGGGGERSQMLPAGEAWSGQMVITPEEGGGFDNSVLFQVLVNGEQ